MFRIAHLDRHTERRIKQSDVVARGVQVLEEEKHKGELVQEVNPQHDAPEGWMRPDERPVAELNHREEQECGCRRVDAPVGCQRRCRGGGDMSDRGSGKTERGSKAVSAWWENVRRARTNVALSGPPLGRPGSSQCTRVYSSRLPVRSR
jgi:hypothetical protein